MKKKSMILIAAGAVVLGILALGLFFMNNGKNDGYRMMQVYQIKGNATIERENVGIMDAYENLNLVSGDRVEVEQDSYMRLKVDEDKYVLAEAGSAFHICATGTENSGKTDIQLEKGSVTVEIQNKLSDDSSFEVSTSNSVMAVRGTVFRITAEVDENGETITKITILEGSVVVQKKDENGELSEEQIVDSGSEAIVYRDVNDLQIQIVDGISTLDIPLEVLEFLQEIAARGRQLEITDEQIKALIEELEREKQEEPSDETQEEITTEEEETTIEESSEEESVAQEPESSQEPEIESETESETEPETKTTQEESSSSQEDSDTEDSDGGTNTKATYTVTFLYNGNVFATQTVEAGGKALAPLLLPSLDGKWDFDFDTPISANTTIEFK